MRVLRRNGRTFSSDTATPDQAQPGGCPRKTRAVASRKAGETREAGPGRSPFHVMLRLRAVIAAPAAAHAAHRPTRHDEPLRHDEFPPASGGGALSVCRYVGMCRTLYILLSYVFILRTLDIAPRARHVPPASPRTTSIGAPCTLASPLPGRAPLPALHRRLSHSPRQTAVPRTPERPVSLQCSLFLRTERRSPDAGM